MCVEKGAYTTARVEDRGQRTGVGLLPRGFCETDLHHQALAADILHASLLTVSSCLLACFFLHIHRLLNLKTYCFLHSKVLYLKETVLISV